MNCYFYVTNVMVKRLRDGFVFFFLCAKGLRSFSLDFQMSACSIWLDVKHSPKVNFRRFSN